MLRGVCFENVINYKDYQRLDFARGANFLLGANSCGKSSILELIRRCLSSDISTTISSTYNNEDAFVMSWYSFEDTTEKEALAKHFKTNGDQLELDSLLVGVYYTKMDRRGHRRYCKVVVFEKESISENGENDTRLFYYAVSYKIQHGNKIDRSSRYETREPCEIRIPNITSISDILKSKENTRELLEKYVAADVDRSPKMLKFFSNFFLRSPCEDILNHLSRFFVMIFPMRSIGVLQWSKSSKITETNRFKNYEEANSRAEILNAYLNGKESDVSDTDVRKIFETITYPSSYNFRLSDKGILIESANNRGEHKAIPILKCPEGIMEAMQIAVILANKMYKTIMIEDPERGMHPQMTKKMVDLVLKDINDKTIVIVSHSPAIVSTWTLHAMTQDTDDPDTCIANSEYLARTFLCRKKQSTESSAFYHTVIPFPKQYSQLAVKEEYSTFLFATNIIFVEGETDLIVLSHLLHALLKDEETSETEKQIITTLHIVGVNGPESYQLQLCQHIGINYINIKDRDAILPFNEKANTYSIKLDENDKNGGGKDLEQLRNEIWSMTPMSIDDIETNVVFKVAYTSGPIFEKIMKRNPIFSVQIINYQIDQKHK